MTPGGPSSVQEASMLPVITITDATPQKTVDAQPLVGLSTPASSPASHAHTPTSSANSTCRLLYRGALSLPDSYLQLDGITFSARLPNRHASTLQDSPSCADASARELMYNPLALALESMRGRQSLRFKGAVSLQDVWTDDTGDVYMDIHPFATLTRVYFENTLCLSPLVAPAHGPKRTQVGVRVSLGDADGPETTDVVIYGETSTLLHPPPLLLSSAATSTSVGPPPLSMRVARITPAPRAPRPDDPTPRQPPTHALGSTTLSDLGKNTRITPRSGTTGLDKGKGKETETVDDHVLRRAREVMLHLPRSNVNGHAKVRDKGTQKEASFKVPELPTKVRRKQGGTKTDVFGAVELPSGQPRSNADGKGKSKVTGVEGDTVVANPIEDANKLVLKKLAVQCLSKAGIPRSHTEFKEIFGFVYRGATFALRSQVRAAHISAQLAEGVVEAHVKMYVLTSSGTHDAPSVQGKTLTSAVGVSDTGG